MQSIQNPAKVNESKKERHKEKDVYIYYCCFNLAFVAITFRPCPCSFNHWKGSWDKLKLLFFFFQFFPCFSISFCCYVLFFFFHLYASFILSFDFYQYYCYTLNCLNPLRTTDDMIDLCMWSLDCWFLLSFHNPAIVFPKASFFSIENEFIYTYSEIKSMLCARWDNQRHLIIGQNLHRFKFIDKYILELLLDSSRIE